MRRSWGWGSDRSAAETRGSLEAISRSRSGVDDLRRRLRSLGYLDAGVDRFVLAPAARHRRPLALGGLASARIGVLAALLLGPAAAIGASARVPGLITGARDGFVVAAYLGLMFGAACSAAASISADTSSPRKNNVMW